MALDRLLLGILQNKCNKSTPPLVQRDKQGKEERQNDLVDAFYLDFQEMTSTI